MPRKSKRRYEPSDSIKKSISTWEGIAMDGPSIDPLSGKLVKQNNSFEEEARLFESKIPKELQDTILNNQSLSDNLFSYSYNVGSGNFEKRVVPALEHYYNNIFGRAKEVTDSMYGNGDSVLSGLAKRRVTEKKGVYDNLPRIIGTSPAQALEYQDVIKTYRPAITPSNTVMDAKKAMQNKVDFHNFMDSISIQNNLPPAYTPKSNIHLEGGFMYEPRDVWEALSMPEKAEMMKVAVRNGITNLQDIRQKYNEFAEGGNIYKEGGKKKSSSANPSAQRAMRYFMDKGLTDYQAAGLVGNLMRESGMNPQALNKGSKAYGLAQWLGPRKKALFARYGNNPSPENQLDFIWSELNSTHRNGLRHLRSSKSAEEAARNAMGYYEFSAGPEAAIANMRKYGQDGEGSMRKGISFASSLMRQPVPAYNSRQNEAAQLSLQESTIPSEGFIYTPLNPQVFGIADTPSYTINVPDQTLASEPQVEESSVSLYSPEELDRQERIDRLSAFNNVLRMTSPQGSGNVFLNAIGMLTGNAFADGGGIHIKPENRGKFTALKKRTGHSATWFKEHGTPAQRKMATFALNARHWKHGLGGNLFSGEDTPTQQMQVGKDYWAQLANKPTWLDTFITPVNGGQLSEVVVKPTNDESWLFSLGKYARNGRKPLADSHARKVVANYLSRFDNESAKDYNARISRLADALDIRGVQFIKNNVESGKLKNRAHYDTKSNTAYIDDIHDIFAEVAHPWQDAKGNNFMDDEFKKGNYDPDIDSRGGTRYAYPDTFEGETHGFFEPALTEWVETGKIGRSLPLLNEDLSNEKIVPKDNIEVLDSAASWNKHAIDKRVIANPHQLPLTKRIQYSIWDYPLLNKKKALGGNLYDGTSKGSQ